MERTSISCALLFLLSLLSMSVQSRSISCTSTRSVNEGESALVTCDYHTNLRRHRRGFYIYKYPFGGEVPDVPAICKWEEDFLRCDLADGYDVRVHGHTMTLNISSAQQVHAGRYVCNILQPEDDIQVEECNLVVKNKENVVKVNCHAIKYPPRGQPVTLMCFVSESLNASTIVLKRHEPPKTAAEELIRCRSNTDMCLTRGFGYQFRFRESATLGFRVIIVLVEKPGRYVCTAEGDHIQHQTCALDVEKDIEMDTVKETSSQHQGIIVYALLLLSVVLAVALAVAFVPCIRKFAKELDRAKENAKKADDRATENAKEDDDRATENTKKADDRATENTKEDDRVQK